MAATGTTFGAMTELLAPMWLELSFMLFFLIGFAIKTRLRGGKGKSADANTRRHLHEQIVSDVEAGQKGAALSAWSIAKTSGPVALETLKIVVQVLLETRPEGLVEEMVEYFGTHREAIADAKSVSAVLDVVARAGRAQLVDDLLRAFKQKLFFRPTPQTYEVLLGCHAANGDEARVMALFSDMSKNRLKVTSRGFSLTIKGFLKKGMLDESLRQMHEMSRRGFTVPSPTAVQLFRAACQKNRSAEIFEATLTVKSLQLPQDAIVVLLEDCQKRDDVELAVRVEKLARDHKAPLSFSAYDILLKMCVASRDTHASDLLQSMQKEGLHLTEGRCVGLLARCAEAKFLRFAEDIVSYVRSKSGMTLACYSALMKVYASCGMLEKACDLHAAMQADGLEPDSMMSGSLMRYSVECGRTELSRELFGKSSSVQCYMSMIKAAGKDRDVDQAFVILEKLKTSGSPVDVAAYNCVLDACVSTGDMKRARTLIVEMQAASNVDIITYNTLLKGYCSKNDVRGGKEVLREMQQAGFTPNDISYNCLINAAVSSGNCREAWNIIETMERSGVAVDHFTLAIMMKGLKKNDNWKDVARALDLLDRSGVDVCANEVLLNTVLETCTKHRHLHRLESIVSMFTKSKYRPSVHTYGSLIKACGVLKRLDKCDLLWHMMVDECALEPNGIVLGCMLDAYVCNDRVEDAVCLLNTWKTKIPPHAVMYSTIIKGFANSRQPARALDVWKELRELGLPLNTVVYNALIDSQARVGAVDAVSKIVEDMESQGCPLDHITHSMIVKGHCIKGDLDKAFEVFRRMQTIGMAVNEIVYNTMLDGCTKHNRMDLVDLVLQDMDESSIQPSIYTLGILVKMYGRRHQLDKAFAAVEDLTSRYGLQLNSQVRASLMGACLSNHDIDRAAMVFEDFRRANGVVDTKSFSSLLSGLVRAGNLRKAVALVDEAYGLGEFTKRGLPSGQVLDADTLEQLMRSLGHRQLMQSLGSPLLERMRAARVPINNRLASLATQTGRGR